jgi:hypothetical protein
MVGGFYYIWFKLIPVVMGWFDFLKSERVTDYYDKEIQFQVDNVDSEKFIACQKYGYVNLWTKPDMDRILIYAPNDAGDRKHIGELPSKYVRLFKQHLLGRDHNKFLVSNYETSVIETKCSTVVFVLKLLSPEVQNKISREVKEREVEALKKELNKEYKLKKPVVVKFYFGEKMHPTKETKLKVGVLSKEYYLNNPSDYKIQLNDEKGNLIAESHAQKAEVMKLIKAHFNNQQLVIIKTESDNRDFLITISTDTSD